MLRLLKVFERVLLHEAAARHVRALEAGPHRVGGAAVHAVPFLRVEDGVVMAQAEAPHVLTAIHRFGYACGLSDGSHVLRASSRSSWVGSGERGFDLLYFIHLDEAEPL